jgi:multidrug efflux system membrane fusion protein
MYRTKPFIAFSGFVLSGVAALLLAGRGDSSAKQVMLETSAPAITAAAVIERPVVEMQELSARIEAVERVEIRSRVSGFIAQVNFKPGAQVKKGDVLFVIDPRPYQAEASRTEAVMRAARSKADLAKLELDRAEKLVADKAIAQREVEERASTYKELDASAHAASAAYDAAKLNLAFTRVASPIDGRASKAEVTLGNLVDSTAVLTSVVSNDTVYASFNGDEDTFLRVGAQARSGKTVTVRAGLANEEGYPHEGTLDFVDNRLDPATGSVRMRALFRNADNTLAPGLFARVQLAPAGVAPLTLLVADRAVGTDQNRKFVYVVTADGKAAYRQVSLGPVVDGLRVVRQGLHAGEKVIVNGLQQVRPNEAVLTVTVPMDTRLTVNARQALKPDSTAPESAAQLKADASAGNKS